ncbi:MAG: hypothetical protein LBD16_03050 [Oscillospiraceae bacterium]|jgi:hypothetical protein|nr:hypothetical protein [Oscillospiraceae bacterium]
MPISFAVYQMRIAQEHDMIASIYTDLNDPDAFCSGYIECVTSKHVLLAALTPWGYRDGWLLWRVTDVQQVFTGDEYEARLEILAKLRNVSRDKLLDLSHAASASKGAVDVLHEMLSHAMNERKTVTVIVGAETYTGKIIAMDDLRVSIDSFDFFGTRDNHATLIPLRDIEQVMLGTEEEKMFDLLAANAAKLSDGHLPPLQPVR